MPVVPTFVSGAGKWSRVIGVVIEKFNIFKRNSLQLLCSTSMLQTVGGLVRTLKQGKEWRVLEPSRWATRVKQGNLCLFLESAYPVKHVL